MHSNLELKSERSPESLIPKASVNINETERHPNAERLERQLAKLHPSKRIAYLETAYIRAIKDLPDNSAGNYIPAIQLAEIMEHWMPDSQDKYRKITYLKNAANRTDENTENSKPYSIIAAEKRQLKAILNSQKCDFF